MISRTKRVIVGDGHIGLSAPTALVPTDAIEVPLGDHIYGAQMMDEVIQEPTMNRYLDRSPKLNTPEDYLDLVKLLQRKRSLFITAEANKKAGIKPGDEDVQAEDNG